ncbi:MAG: adenosine deaminase [Ardenticatenaceae bacterium]|nr:adenosine deaminase [Anaerolineales bacterium]MCB8940563.1 adenosine deaminase [Ardenticatenaceae bacterium]MCB8973583.1 adenosine deaminase [Ardenticatenaceae bacterium]
MTQLSDKLTNFIQQMPKAELHIHLEGSIQPKTVLELARRHNKLHTLPSDNEDGLRQWFTFVDFPHFVDIYLIIQDLIRTADDFALIVYENGADMAAQNIRYREITVTPYTHTDIQDKGLNFAELFSGLENGRAQAKKDFGVEMRWVFDIARNLTDKPDGSYDPTPAEKTLAYALEGKAKGSVVGFGLGGYEVGYPPELFTHAFEKAKVAGLLSVPHAGEHAGPASIWGSIRALQADRLGHGVRAIEDPALLATLKVQQIPLEVNITSNLCLKVFPSLATHPVRQLDDRGLFITINTDDPPLFNATLVQEYTLLAQEFGYDAKGLARIARNAFVAAGVEPNVKERLLKEFDAWVRKNR